MNQPEIVEVRNPTHHNSFACEREMTNEEQSALKCEINNLIWMWSPSNLTLSAAEELACQILKKIQKGE